MTLECEKFEIFATEFLSLSTSFGDEWMKKRIDSNGKDFYLEKRSVFYNSKIQKSENGNYDDLSSNSFSVFVYHIVYSQSYSVPILYFNAYHADGKLLTLEEIWNKIPNCYQDSVKINKWNMITQQEHPELGIPYFTIHPCYTADFMSSCKSSNYLITWLSIVGPLVGLNLLCEYAKHVTSI